MPALLKFKNEKNEHCFGMRRHTIGIVCYRIRINRL